MASSRAMLFADSAFLTLLTEVCSGTAKSKVKTVSFAFKLGVSLRANNLFKGLFVLKKVLLFADNFAYM